MNSEIKNSSEGNAAKCSSNVRVYELSVLCHVFILLTEARISLPTYPGISFSRCFTKSAASGVKERHSSPSIEYAHLATFASVSASSSPWNGEIPVNLETLRWHTGDEGLNQALLTVNVISWESCDNFEVHIQRNILVLREGHKTAKNQSYSACFLSPEFVSSSEMNLRKCAPKTCSLSGYVGLYLSWKPS